MPFSTPGDLPNPGIEPTSPSLQEDSLALSHEGSPFWHRYAGPSHSFGPWEAWIRARWVGGGARVPGPPPTGLGGAGGVCSPNSPGAHTANLGLLGLPGPELNAPPPYPHLGKKPD